ncbi:MAG TPA: hypothetical protein DDW52_27020 [Planctomycetaceae bacterium]|nr:hypothetical protein [Planctomycetaceae bacterium]
MKMRGAPEEEGKTHDEIWESLDQQWQYEVRALGPWPNAKNVKDVLNQMAKDGWEFDGQMQTPEISGSQTSFRVHLVFRKPAE